VIFFSCKTLAPFTWGYLVLFTEVWYLAINTRLRISLLGIWQNSWGCRICFHVQNFKKKQVTRLKNVQSVPNKTKFSKFNIMHLPCYYIIYIDFWITSLFHNFIFVCIRCYMFRPWMSAILKELPAFSTYTAYLATYVYVSGRLYTSVSVLVKLQCQNILANQ
jgi:hypothetical protein